jgi:hypothetical protein
MKDNSSFLPVMSTALVTLRSTSSIMESFNEKKTGLELSFHTTVHLLPSIPYPYEGLLGVMSHCFDRYIIRRSTFRYG